MKTNKETITLEKSEVVHLYRCMAWGDLGDLANLIGCSKAFVTQMFKPKKEYSIEAKKYIDVYRMRTDHYLTILEFIKMKQ
jgi:hypothetical protein